LLRKRVVLVSFFVEFELRLVHYKGNLEEGGESEREPFLPNWGQDWRAWTLFSTSPRKVRNIYSAMMPGQIESRRIKESREKGENLLSYLDSTSHRARTHNASEKKKRFCAAEVGIKRRERLSIRGTRGCS